MQLEGSCHCRRVRFTVESATPVPYQRCYCSICRKVQGGGGFSINLGADARTLSVTGRRHLRRYHARLDEGRDADPALSDAERTFCGHCGSGLWLFDPNWPDLLHPYASAIDSTLPTPPAHTHILIEDKAGWVEPAIGRKDTAFDGLPEESIAAWHERRGLTS